MILMILFISLTIISIIGIIVFNYFIEERFIFPLFALSICILIVSGFATIGGGVACITINEDREPTRERLNKQVIELTFQYETLSAAEDGYAKYIAVENYNEEVKEFKKTIRDGQNVYKNPWTSWFSTPVYLEFSEDMVSYITLN